MTTLIACSNSAPHPYTLTNPIAQTGPHHILMGQGIDINSADVATLEALPGVGPALARRIVNDRTANGHFVSIQDLQRVSGIGEKTIQRLAALIQVSSKN